MRIDEPICPARPGATSLKEAYEEIDAGIFA
jgi:hypothetical protein